MSLYGSQWNPFSGRSESTQEIECPICYACGVDFLHINQCERDHELKKLDEKILNKEGQTK